MYASWVSRAKPAKVISSIMRRRRCDVATEASLGCPPIRAFPTDTRRQPIVQPAASQLPRRSRQSNRGYELWRRGTCEGRGCSHKVVVPAHQIGLALLDRVKK